MDEQESAVIAALNEAGEAGLTRPRLTRLLDPRKQNPDAARRRLAQLETEGAVVNIGTEKTPRYLLPALDRRLDRAGEAILARATPGQPTVFNAAALRKGRARGIKRPLIDQSIAALVARRELFVIQAGKSVYYLHARSIAPLLGLAPADAFQPEHVREAYATLVREGGFADVTIHQLAQRSGAALDALKPWLQAESRAGRAAPTRGDWSLADAPARAAAIDIRGEPHLQIRLL